MGRIADSYVRRAELQEQFSGNQGHHPMTDKPKVTQATNAAREAAAMYADADGEYYADPEDRAEYCRAVRAGELDGDMLVQAFENLYRIAAEQSRDDVIKECAKALQWFVDRKWTLQAKFDLHGPAKTANALRENLKRSEDALRNLKGKKS